MASLPMLISSLNVGMWLVPPVAVGWLSLLVVRVSVDILRGALAAGLHLVATRDTVAPVVGVRLLAEQALARLDEVHRRPADGALQAPSLTGVDQLLERGDLLVGGCVFSVDGRDVSHG